MTMQVWNGDIEQALKWMHSNAPNIQSLIMQKKAWYAKYQDQFWADWQANVFNLDTANNFGLMIWCIILGVPSQLFGLYPPDRAFAYGEFRQNFVGSTGPNPSPGGNFYGGGEFTLLTAKEIRWALKLRYSMLVGNARLMYINRMLNWIFNDGLPWDIAGGKYVYVTDVTGDAGQIKPPPGSAFQLVYHCGPNMGFSAQFINLLNATQYGILPQAAGSKTTVIQD
jgi:hypothetical protein